MVCFSFRSKSVYYPKVGGIVCFMEDIAPLQSVRSKLLKVPWTLADCKSFEALRFFARSTNNKHSLDFLPLVEKSSNTYLL